MASKRVLTVGSATIDTVAVVESDRIERLTMRNADTSFLMLEDGRKTDALEVSTHCGGGAINAAVAMARLGHKVATLVKLGCDERARTVLARLAAEGISKRFVRQVEGVPTGASVMVSSHDRNAAIFTYRGANTTLVADDIDAAALDADVVYIASLSNRSADCFPSLVERAKRNGAFVATNPGIRQLSARGRTWLGCLRHIDVLIVNRVEAEAMIAPLIAQFGESEPPAVLAPGADLPEAMRRSLSAGGFEMSLPSFLATLVRQGPQYVALTMGRHGALLATGNDLFHGPAVEQPVAGTAGAGDAFAATLVSYLALGEPCEAALTAASINAASVIGFVDTQTGLLDSHTLQTRMAERADRTGVRRWSYVPNP